MCLESCVSIVSITVMHISYWEIVICTETLFVPSEFLRCSSEWVLLHSLTQKLPLDKIFWQLHSWAVPTFPCYLMMYTAWSPNKWNKMKLWRVSSPNSQCLFSTFYLPIPPMCSRVIYMFFFPFLLITALSGSSPKITQKVSWQTKILTWVSQGLFQPLHQTASAGERQVTSAANPEQ